MKFKELGRAIRHARKAQGLTQQALSDLSGVSLSVIHKIEKGQGDLSLGSLLAVLDSLGMRCTVQSPLGSSFDLIDHG
ncbi:MAG: type II toxin-antitoxin system Y4mF family antitoxin [Opitutales bacterium]